MNKPFEINRIQGDPGSICTIIHRLFLPAHWTEAETLG